MGAGNSKDHKVQDTGEKYVVFQLQKMAVEANKSISGSYVKEEKDFLDYGQEKGVLGDFNKSVYKTIYDTNLSDFFSGLTLKHPTSNFDFIDVEAELRNQNKKGDFLIMFTDGTPPKSFSLKAYKKGYGRPQLNSGTWGSMVLNVLLPKVGVGQYQMPDGTKYKSSDLNKRDAHLAALSYDTPEIKAWFHFNDNEAMPYIKKTYRDDPHAQFWQNIQSQWKQDCHSLAHKAIKKVIDVFNSLPNEVVKKQIIKMAGLDHKEELLLLGKKGYMSSYTNKDYMKLLNRVNSINCKMQFRQKKKSLLFVFSDESGDIVDIEVPFTLQANGAWHRPKKNQYTGVQYHLKEKMNLAWGQRRPKKSKELATSINTYMNLNKAMSVSQCHVTA